jgi:hypothetical protein
MSCVRSVKPEKVLVPLNAQKRCAHENRVLRPFVSQWWY